MSLPRAECPSAFRNTGKIGSVVEQRLYGGRMRDLAVRGGTPLELTIRDDVDDAHIRDDIDDPTRDFRECCIEVDAGDERARQIGEEAGRAFRLLRRLACRLLLEQLARLLLGPLSVPQVAQQPAKRLAACLFDARAVYADRNAATAPRAHRRFPFFLAWVHDAAAAAD